MLRTPLLPSSFWLAAGALALAGLSVLAVSYSFPALPPPSRRRKQEEQGDTSISIAFLGNSILYFNDCPRLVEHMLKTRFEHVVQNSCLRGGASLPSLLEKGNGMHQKFATPPAIQATGSYDTGEATVQALLKSRGSWDFVVMNDYTQAPARLKTRQETQQVLRHGYRELLKDANPVFVQTAAYRYPNMRDTEDLGDFEEFTARLHEGYQVYMKTLPGSRVAPVGQAFLWLHQYNRTLWNKLYSWDNFHYSPHGTWLEACCIFCVVTGLIPPPLNAQWWESARFMQPPDEKPLPLPTMEEAMELRHVACLVCGVSANATNADHTDAVPLKGTAAVAG